MRMIKMGIGCIGASALAGWEFNNPFLGVWISIAIIAGACFLIEYKESD